VRVDPVLWARAKSKAAEQGKSISDVIRDFLVAFVAKDESGA
jgi:predicted HicB family RNase H-like nuclease